MADKFKETGASLSKYSRRFMGLIADTSNVLHVTRQGIVPLIKLLLTKDFCYILPGMFQSAFLEGEFGIYRQSSGGCYYILVQQMMNSLPLQRLKLLDKLEIESKNTHIEDDSCTASLNEVEMLNECFELASKLTFTKFPVMLQLKSIYPLRSMTLLKSSTHIPNLQPFSLEENSHIRLLIYLI